VTELTAYLNAEAEVALRLALRSACARFRRDRAWTARIDALLAQIDPHGQKLSHLLAEARKIEAIIREAHGP